jgi:hypothetical protein
MSRDPLRHVGYIALPPHSGKGGFDHAAVHAASGHVYVAHTANNAVDVFVSLLDFPSTAQRILHIVRRCVSSALVPPG